MVPSAWAKAMERTATIMIATAPASMSNSRLPTPRSESLILGGSHCEFRSQDALVSKAKESSKT